MGLGWQVIHALSDRRVLATGSADLRALARIVIAAAGDALLAFRASDNHLHTSLLCDRAEAGAYARRVSHGLRAVLPRGVSFEPTQIREIRNQGHLAAQFSYVLGNAEHHNSKHDPWFEASNLPDLLGLRPLAARSRAVVRSALPRVDRGELLGLLGVDALEPSFEPDLLPDAAAAAMALPDVSGRTPDAVAARVAAAHLAARHLSPGEVDRLLGIPPRTGARLRAMLPESSLIRAIGLQIDLRRRRPAIAPDAAFE